jgi:hypothetical protein
VNGKHRIGFLVMLTIICLGLACEKDTILPPEGTYVQRYVTEITEANLSGQGGDVAMPQLEASPAAGNAGRMSMVLAYGDKRTSDSWTPLETEAYSFTEGLLHIDATVGNSNVYRILVLK